MLERTREQARRALAGNVVFGALETAELDALMAYGTNRRCDAGQVIFEKGDAGDSMMVVLSGRVRIGSYLPHGREAILNFLGPGEVLGEIAMLDGKPRSADAVAAEPTALYVLQRRELIPFFEAHPAVTLRIVEVLCERLRRATEMVEELLCLSSGPRIAIALLRIAEDHAVQRDGTLALEVKLSQSELGNHVGLGRESVNRQLQAWRKLGILDDGNGRITVLQPQRLQAIAAS